MKKETIKTIVIIALIVILSSAIGWTYLDKHLKAVNECKSSLEYLINYKEAKLNTDNGEMTLGQINKLLLISK